LATNTPLFEPAADVFATKYGLLGLLQPEYFVPILPWGKARLLIAPELSR
jgi:hypothetical protein